MGTHSRLQGTLDAAFGSLKSTMQNRAVELMPQEVGRVVFIGHGTARIEGLPGVGSHELIRFPGDRFGMAFNLDPNDVGVILLDRVEGLQAGDEVNRTQRVLDVPVGEALLGRVSTALDARSTTWERSMRFVVCQSNNRHTRSWSGRRSRFRYKQASK